MVKCLQGKMYEEWQVLISALWWQRWDPRGWHGVVPGEGQAGCKEEVLHQRAVGIALSCQS